MLSGIKWWYWRELLLNALSYFLSLMSATVRESYCMWSVKSLEHFYREISHTNCSDSLYFPIFFPSTLAGKSFSSISAELTLIRSKTIMCALSVFMAGECRTDKKSSNMQEKTQWQRIEKCGEKPLEEKWSLMPDNKTWFVRGTLQEFTDIKFTLTPSGSEAAWVLEVSV